MDHDGDGDVDSADLAAFTDCLGGVNRLPVATQADCSGMCITAFDSDGDFDSRPG
jgi:hypothetical protein